MDSLEAELAEARALDVDALAAAIESIGFECTRCGACCRAETCGSSDGTVGDAVGDGSAVADGTGTADSRDATADARDTGGTAADPGATEPHTATVFPDEVRRLQAAAEDAVDVASDWRDVARPMPYGLREGRDGPEGETFEWALQTDDCGDCTFYRAGEDDEPGACTVHGDRPLICRTYPFSLALGGTSQPMGDAVDREGNVRAHECEGLGRDIDAGAARELASALRERAVRELEEAIAVRDGYEPVDATDGEVVVHDSEGAKRPDGTHYE
jgi:Fe-S-cluster containining protein